LSWHFAQNSKLCHEFRDRLKSSEVDLSELKLVLAHQLAGAPHFLQFINEGALSYFGCTLAFDLLWHSAQVTDLLHELLAGGIRGDLSVIHGELNEFILVLGHQLAGAPQFFIF